MPDRPAYSFGDGPPRAVSDFLSTKANRPTFGWRAMEPREHAVAFTVAKSAGFDILGDVREELQRALDQGQTFETFRRNLRPRLVAKGWWGRAEVEGPGGKRQVQLGSNRRLRTIYRANMRSARAAGQWDRIQRTKAALPYLMYRLGPSERHRPHHESKQGWSLPADDPFWDEWFPPNGWGCKCWVRQVDRGEAERDGQIVEQVNIPRRQVRDPVTGRARDLPAGLEPAWAGNPGRTRARNAEDWLAGRIAAADPDTARVALEDVVRSWRVSRLPDGPRELTAPVGRLPAALAEAMGVETPVVSLAGGQARKIARRHVFDPERLARVQRAVESGVLLRYPDGDLLTLDFGAGPAAGAMPLLATIQGAGYPRPRLTTAFVIDSSNYLRNTMRRGLTVLRGEETLEAFFALNPVGGRR